jgi:hypothetical protein
MIAVFAEPAVFAVVEVFVIRRLGIPGIFGTPRRWGIEGHPLEPAASRWCIPHDR